MSDKNQSRRGDISLTSHRRGRLVSEDAAKRAFAERIARQVLSMTPEEVDAFIVERGLSHLADPERMAELLNIAVNMPADSEAIPPRLDAKVSSTKLKDLAFELRERTGSGVPPSSRRH